MEYLQLLKEQSGRGQIAYTIDEDKNFYLGILVGKFFHLVYVDSDPRKLRRGAETSASLIDPSYSFKDFLKSADKKGTYSGTGNPEKSFTFQSNILKGKWLLYTKEGRVFKKQITYLKRIG